MQKVDATYLSPHVNMAARCETAAKQWHVQVFKKMLRFYIFFLMHVSCVIQILCTDIFHSCLSKAAQKNMRLLDRVLVKGSATPMNMFTYDTFQDQEMVRKHDKKAWGLLG